MTHPIHDAQLDRLPIDDLSEIDHVIIGYSGGKDSQACTSWALQHFPKHKIELWHHDVDGAKGENAFGVYFDWEVTRRYCEATAKAYDLPLQFSWREGGLGAEMFKEDKRTNDILFQDPKADIVRLETTTRAKIGTRRKFPAITADLKTRWCSGCAKISVGSRVLNSLERFKAEPGQKPPVILFLTGERREESTSRSKYTPIAENKPTRYRHVIKYRPVLDWSEAEVWQTIEESKITPHPAYYLGYGRCSCQTCIFGTPDHWATVQDLSPEKIDRIEEVEIEFGFTLNHKKTIREMVAKGQSFVPSDIPREYIDRVLRGEFDDSQAVSENWVLPCGAFKGSKGGAL